MGIQLLENSLVTGAALMALILALQPVSASFNPVVTLVEVALRRVRAGTAAVLVAAQVVGATLGAVSANVMFGVPAVLASHHVRSSGALWFSEAVATAGLVVVVFSALRSPPPTLALAVGGYITAAYWFTSSTSFANPALTVARALSDTFTGIAPASVPMFVAMQLAGGAVGYLAVRGLSPSLLRPSESRPGAPVAEVRS